MTNALRFTVEVPVPDNAANDPMALTAALVDVDAGIVKNIFTHGIREYNITHTPFTPWVWNNPQYVLPAD